MSNHRKEGNVQCQKCNSDNGSTGLARSYVISRGKVCGSGGGEGEPRRDSHIVMPVCCIGNNRRDLHANCSAPTSVFQFPLFSLRKSEPSVSKSIQQFYFNIILNQLCCSQTTYFWSVLEVNYKTTCNVLKAERPAVLGYSCILVSTWKRDVRR